MKTIAYVDGYNFYHGRLKHTAYKWLDLPTLIGRIVKEQNPDAELIQVRFYTAMIKAALARKGQLSANAQQAYHRALQARGVDVVLGKFVLTEGTAAARHDGRSVDRDERVDIWSLSEKQTDLQLGLGVYRDAVSARCEQVLLCTNDSDLAPALQSVREDCPGIRIGVLLPRAPGMLHRKSGTLEALAHWTRHHIHDHELAAAQLPTRVPTSKKPIDKPLHWNTQA